MFDIAGRWMLLVGAATTASAMIPVATPSHAQGWGGGQSCRGVEGRDRQRCERGRGPGRHHGHRDRDRERRKDAKRDGIVAGVVGTAILGGIIVAAASGDKKNKERRERRD